MLDACRRATHTKNKAVINAQSSELIVFWLISQAGSRSLVNIKWSRGVTVSTLDSESNDRGSNPRETFDCVVLLNHYILITYAIYRT